LEATRELKLSYRSAFGKAEGKTEFWQDFRLVQVWLVLSRQRLLPMLYETHTIWKMTKTSLIRGKSEGYKSLLNLMNDDNSKFIRARW